MIRGDNILRRIGLFLFFWKIEMGKRMRGRESEGERERFMVLLIKDKL